MATFKQLEALITVVDQGTFESAAARLRVAQSAISRQIQELESWLGFELFDRSARTARLTPNAGDIVDQARQILLQRETVNSCLISNDVLNRTLRLGITELSALTWLPHLVKAVATHYPKVHIEPEIDLSVRLYEMLIAGQLDLIVVPDAFHSNGLIKVALDTVNNGWFCAPGLLDHTRTLSLKDVSQQTLLAQGNQSGSGLLMGQWLAEHHAVPVNYIPCSSLVALVGLAVAGLGVTYLPYVVAEPSLASGQLVQARVEPTLPVTAYVALGRADTCSPFHRHILDLMLLHCNLQKPYERSSPARSHQGAFDGQR
ncbi:LysR family transcriptional regulator [Pseudomonas sp.]|uniref:LysR family transcriptional regulator n=1 Tax=Pseudomonas sp. TaxID=306 RepID=UPI0026074B8E|nr:LysR family transcriptional regulator [Pseudomonas sp.]